MNGILSDVYLGCMIIGNFFEKNLKNDEYFEDEEWFGTEHCATFAKVVYTFANTVDISMETACRKVFDMIKTCGFNKVEDHGYDDYARGFLAGEVLGIPTEDAKKKAERAEEIWFHSSKRYGYYQEVLNDLKNDVYEVNFKTRIDALNYASDTIGKNDYELVYVQDKLTFLTSTNIPIELRFREPIEIIVEDFLKEIRYEAHDIDDIANYIGAEICSILIDKIEEETGVSILSSYDCY